jgi:hypothetical protein
VHQRQPPCSGYCGRPSTTAVEWVKRSWSKDDEGNLVLNLIEAIEIPVCAACSQRAVEGNGFFTFCVADNHWGATGHECRGGCGRRLYGQILEPEPPAAGQI